MKHLLSPNIRIRGCHIRIPDIVFFKNGKTHLRVKTDNENFLVEVKNLKKMKKTEIRSQFPTITRERRKRNLDQADIEDIIMDEQEVYKEFGLPAGKTLHGNYYRDIAIAQLYTKNYVPSEEVNMANEQPVNLQKLTKPLSENEFLKLMSRRPNDEYWKKVEFIQTCIKSRLGIGTPIVIDFYAKINKRAPSREIQYDFSKFAKDHWLMLNDPKQYCQKQ